MSPENERWLATTLNLVAAEAQDRGIVPPWTDSPETILELAVEFEANPYRTAEIRIA